MFPSDMDTDFSGGYSIVTDPPYGVRAGAKRTGRKDPSRLRQEPYIFPADHPNAGMEANKLPTCQSLLPPFISRCLY